MGDINALSIDSICFGGDYGKSIAALKESLAPGGRMAFLYSYGLEPWVKVEDFPAGQLEAYAAPHGKGGRNEGRPGRSGP